ncbi:MAG: glycosyltransferase [Patescibacteria group bacterium]|nr:glycosyltransferase [Patescibacteria group bacterium]
MQALPLFSILICSVGKTELVEGAIHSITSQNFDDVEIIVTDTSGTNSIRSLVESLDDNRIHFYEVPELDPTIGWEFAYTKSTGRYVLWYDDDNQLIPGSLAQYAKIITEQGADIVSANHVYYFGEGNRHDPGHDNALTVLLPYSGTTKVYDRDTLLSAVSDLRMGRPAMPARWHSAATFVSRDICEQAERDVGYIVAPHMYGNYTLHPLIFWYAKKPLYYDQPLCVIGKFASSITQQWSNTFVKPRRISTLPYRYTGVSVRTLGNTTAECYLKVQHDLPALERYPFNWETFYRRYISELLFLKIPFGRHLHAWREAWRAVARTEPSARRRLRRQILKQFTQSLGLRLLRAVHVWDAARSRMRGAIPRNDNRKTIPLSPYGIHTIDECAQRLDEVLSQALGVRFQ